MEELLRALDAQRAVAEADQSAAAADRAAAAAALAQAKEAAARAARSLTASLNWVDARRRRLDAIVEQLRGSGAEALTLVGETFEALRLARVDVSVAREKVCAMVPTAGLFSKPVMNFALFLVQALVVLGLQPLAARTAVRKGERLVLIGAEEALERSRNANTLGAPNTPLVEVTAATDASSLDIAVQVSIDGAPAVSVAREELAQWFYAPADDLSLVSCRVIEIRVILAVGSCLPAVSCGLLLTS